MVQKIQIKRTETPGAAPSGLSPGELAVEMATPTKLWVGVPAAIDVSERKLLIDTSASGGGGLDQATADGLYVNVLGDTMTGPLTVLSGAGGDGGKLTGVAGQIQFTATGASADVAVVMSSKGNGGWTVYTNDFGRMAFGVGATGTTTDTFVNVYPGIGESQVVNNPQANPIRFNSSVNLIGGTAPTLIPGTATTDIATTQFVADAILDCGTY